jgi:2-polyprenyl-3-methyl-5-hydroxy-6-metoxy-1,4-benzoquinol methylase
MEKSEQKNYALEQADGSSEDSIYQSVLEKIREYNLLNNKISLLDIGCGKGSFLKQVNEKALNKSLTGTDLYDYSSELGFNVSWIKQDLNKEPSQTFAKYDLITAIEVIEHLENPRKFVRDFTRLLSDDGHILITTPNLDSYTSLISFALRGYHSAFGPKSYPAHITAVSSRDLLLIIKEQENLEIIEQYFIPNGRIPGTSFKWNTLFPFLSGKRFSDNYITIIKKRKV